MPQYHELMNSSINAQQRCERPLADAHARLALMYKSLVKSYVQPEIHPSYPELVMPLFLLNHLDPMKSLAAHHDIQSPSLVTLIPRSSDICQSLAFSIFS